MTSTVKSSPSQLGESWVVDDSSDSRDRDGSADVLEDHSSLPQPKAGGLSNVDTPSISFPSKPRRASRTPSTAPEPEFIMPSVHESMTDGLRVNPAPSSPKRKARARGTNAHSLQNMNRSGQLSRQRPTTSQRMQSQPHPPSWASSGEDAVAFLRAVATWILEIVGGAMSVLKRPISWVLAAYAFAGLAMLVQNILSQSVYTALSPLCRIPGVSRLGLPICQPPFDAPRIDAKGSAPVEFDQLMTVQSQFEEVLEQAAAGVSLPLDMKRSETSIRDLRQIVRFSQLPSKNELVLEFDGFIETARIASYDLQKFNSHVGRGVDIVLSTARWTQRVLDDMAVKRSSRGLIPSFIGDTLLAPFQPLQFTESRLLDQYIKHTRVVSDEIDSLIAEAQALLQVLQNLEDRLEVMHSIALRDNIHAQGSKDEILSQLWTVLGGNRAALGKYNNQLKLLKQVGEYRKVAWAHVSGTILKLQAMGAELEELRTRVSSAEVLRDHTEIPLSVHVDSIRLGVERLERSREAAREIERGHIRRVLDKTQDMERQLLVDG